MRYRKGYDNEDKKMEGVGTAKRYMEGNCEGGQSPSGTVESRKEKKNFK